MEINQLNSWDPWDEDYAAEDEEGACEEKEDTEDQKNYKDFEDSLSDIDFSQMTGDFKKSFPKVKRKINQGAPTGRPMATRPKAPIAKPKKPLSKSFFVKKKAIVESSNNKKLAKVIVPRNRKVIVEGVSKFILSKDPKDDSLRNIGYYEGKKLKELVLTFNNNSALDFNLELFNPSMPMDYLQATSLNLNDKIQVAGGAVSYSDVLFNLLANPALLVNAKFVFAGPNVATQMAIPLQVINKEITGVEKIQPLNLALKMDTMQVQGDMVFFDVMGSLNRAFIPDGMDVLGYRIMPGMSVTMAFFYKQVSLKKFFYKEAKNSKELL